MRHPYPPNGPSRLAATRVYSPLCGEGLEGQSYLTPPRGAPKRPGQDRRNSGVAAAVWGGVEVLSYMAPPRASSSPTRPRHDWRDSAVAAAVWGRVGSPNTHSPLTERPYPPSGSGGTGGTPVYQPLCGEGWKSSHTWPPHGASLSLIRSGRTGGTQVHRPLCGGSGKVNHT